MILTLCLVSSVCRGIRTCVERHTIPEARFFADQKTILRRRGPSTALNAPQKNRDLRPLCMVCEGLSSRLKLIYNLVETSVLMLSPTVKDHDSSKYSCFDVIKSSKDDCSTVHWLMTLLRHRCRRKSQMQEQKSKTRKNEKEAVVKSHSSKQHVVLIPLHRKCARLKMHN